MPARFGAMTNGGGIFGGCAAIYADGDGFIGIVGCVQRCAAAHANAVGCAYAVYAFIAYADDAAVYI